MEIDRCCDVIDLDLYAFQDYMGVCDDKLDEIPFENEEVPFQNSRIQI
jgi:hypothetical protein